VRGGSAYALERAAANCHVDAQHILQTNLKNYCKDRNTYETFADLLGAHSCAARVRAASDALAQAPAW
jgi:hypothetical protein